MSSMAPAMPARIRGDRRHEQPHQNNHKMDRATHWKPMQGNSKKVLYIISGASCSGKSTLLEAWKADRLDLFGEQRRARSISLGNGKEAVTCVDRIQGGALPVLNMHGFQVLANSGREHSSSIVLHVDLSHFFKHEYTFRMSESWQSRIGLKYPDLERAGPLAVRTFWELGFSQFSRTPLSLKRFSQMYVSTIYCGQNECRIRKLQRDSRWLSRDHPDHERHRHTFLRLYENTKTAKHNYYSHYQGWMMFINSITCSPCYRTMWKYNRKNSEYVEKI